MKGHDYTLCLFCAKWDNNINFKKKSETRLEKKEIQLVKLLKTFSCYTTYAHVV